MSACNFCSYPLGETDWTNKMKYLIYLDELKDKFGKLLYPYSNFAYCIDDKYYLDNILQTSL